MGARSIQNYIELIEVAAVNERLYNLLLYM